MIGFTQHKALFVTGILLLDACTITAVYTQQIFIAFLPAAIAISILLLRHQQILFYCLLAAIPWSVEYNINNTLATDLPDEPLMWLATITVIAWWLYHYKRVFKKFQPHPLLLLLLVQFVWMFVTALFSTDHLLSVKFIVAKSWFIASFVAMPLLLLNTKKDLKKAAVVLAASMMLAIITALVRHAFSDFTFSTINTSLAPFFRNHVNYSALLVCTIPVLVVLTFHAENKKLKGFLKCLLVVTLAALYFSYSRGAWAALLAGAAAYFLLKKRFLVKGFLLAIVICMAGLLWLQHNSRYLKFGNDFKTTIFHEDFEEHLVATYQLKDVSTAERFYRWVAGVRMIKHQPITGYGPNTFYNNYKSYTIPEFKTWVSDNKEHSTVHNYFLLTTIEQGLPGLVFLLSLITCLFYTAQKIYCTSKDLFWKNVAACIAVILSMVCTLNFLSDLIETDKIGSIFYLCIGFLIIADHQSRKKNEQHQLEISNLQKGF